MKLRLGTFGPATALFCELLGLSALALTPDVERVLFFAPLAFGLVTLVSRFRLPDGLLLLSVAILVLGGYATAGAEPTGTLVARALIPAHAFLWLAHDEKAYRFWRLGVALIELVLASILSPEAYMFVLIFLFVLVSSLALSLGFLERRFRERDPEALARPIRGSFVGSVLALSCLIFLSSLLIFPILPRSHWSGNGGDTSTGYNDVVSFQQGILRWGRQAPRPALWLFRDDGKRWEEIAPFFLLRGQALERFDGQEWRAMAPARSEATGKFQVESSVEILRQALPTDILPVPYGTLAVQSVGEYPVGPLGPGEWVAHGARAKSVRYEARLGPARDGEYGRETRARTTSFSPTMFPGIARLAAKLAKGAPGPEEKIEAVRRYFREGGFTAELRPVAPYHPGETHPLEDFLFRTRSGHCEMFASSAALLLRALGVPSRLVVGFRVRPPSRGNVLTVKTTDAHAWVEAWSPRWGWHPLDPTPFTGEPSWLGEAFGEASDWVGAYWNRYILEYEFDSDSLLALARPFVGVLSLLALLLGGFFWWRRSRGAGIPGRERMAEILSRFEEDLIHRVGIFPYQAYRDLPDAMEWKERYQAVRFGREEPGAAELRELRSHAQKVITRAATRSVPAPPSAG